MKSGYVALTTHDMALAPPPIIAGSSGMTGLVKHVKVLADVVHVASCLFKNGPQYLKELLDGLKTWMTAERYQRSLIVKAN